jgi:hypothetical protein
MLLLKGNRHVHLFKRKKRASITAIRDHCITFTTFTTTHLLVTYDDESFKSSVQRKKIIILSSFGVFVVKKTQSKILHFINIFYSKSKYLRTTAWLAGQKFGTDLKQTYSIGRLKSFVTFT